MPLCMDLIYTILRYLVKTLAQSDDQLQSYVQNTVILLQFLKKTPKLQCLA